MSAVHSAGETERGSNGIVFVIFAFRRRSRMKTRKTEKAEVSGPNAVCSATSTPEPDKHPWESGWVVIADLRMSGHYVKTPSLAQSLKQGSHLALTKCTPNVPR